jgi:hypothetical protein
VTRFLLLILFIATIGGRVLGLDLGLAPGLSIKNALLYFAASAIAIESATLRDRKIELLPVIVPFGLLVLYASMSWLILVLFVENPYYSALGTLIRLKVKLVDQFLVLLVFFYGIVNWKEALWLLKALAWVVLIGCFLTVVDSFDVPDLGVITSRDSDGRVEGFIGSAQDFGALLAFYFPVAIAMFWGATGLKKLVVLLGTGMLLVSIMLSASRGAMVGVVVGAITAAIYLRRYISRQTILRAAFAFVAFTIVSAAVVMSTQYGDLLATRLGTGLSTGDAETVSSGRSAIWGAALREMADQPLSFIAGLGWEAYYSTGGYRFATHSVYLDRLYNLGTIGLVLFLASFVGVVAVARRSLASAPKEAVPYLIATVIGMTSFVITMAFSDIFEAAPYVWAFTGLALRIAVSHESQPAAGAPSYRAQPPINRDQKYFTTRPTSVTPRR